ncbi:Uncharacterised protein [Raoultella planticola]|uniref:Uncharacterized protein n=1 Tax=Raoultella planticola TaxID=575 RepID=A0A485A877_RAOPL|nr:Uncharacterised protein [Raoultella planticola]
MNNDTQTIIASMSAPAACAPASSTLQGKLLAHATREITLFRSAGNQVEHPAARFGWRSASV